jgi:hypothetical protein
MRLFLIFLLIILSIKSFSQTDTITISDRIKVYIDSTLWQRKDDPEMKFGWDNKKTDKFYFTIKTVQNPNFRDISPEDFISKKADQVKEDVRNKKVKISSLQTFGNFKYYIFSYTEEGKKVQGAFAAFNKNLPYKFIIVFGAENHTLHLIKENLEQIIRGVVVAE